jgi:hypothetical protein
VACVEYDSGDSESKETSGLNVDVHGNNYDVIMM